MCLSVVVVVVGGGGGDGDGYCWTRSLQQVPIEMLQYYPHPVGQPVHPTTQQQFENSWSTKVKPS